MLLTLDGLTIVLLLVLLLLLTIVILLRPPPPPAHPFLLGRQSIPSRTRLQHESPIYTNNASGGLRAPLRPGKLRTLGELVSSSDSKLGSSDGALAEGGGEQIKDLVLALKEGIQSALGSAEGAVAVLVENPTDSLLLTLALALTSNHKPIVFSPGSAIPTSLPPLAAIVYSSVYQSLADSLSTSVPAFLVGGDGATVTKDWLATGRAVLEGNPTKTKTEAATVDVKSTVLTLVSDGIPLEFSHVNITASIVSWLSLFPGAPHSTRPTSSSHILSYHHPATPYGLGLALFTLFTSSTLSHSTLPVDTPSTPGASAVPKPLVTFPSTPPATQIFAPSPFAAYLNTTLLSTLTSSSLRVIQFSRFWKLRLLNLGVVSKTTIADSLLFASPRKTLNLGADLQAVFISGPVGQSRAELFRVFLGVPIVVGLQHAFGLAPIASAMMFDFQRLLPPWSSGHRTGKEYAAVGAPVVGAEIKIRGKEEDMEKGVFKGELLLRAPILPRPELLPSALLMADTALPQLPPLPSARTEGATDENLAGPGIGGAMWLRTGVTVEMGKEGGLWVLT